jgi:hypothetical protein
MSDHVHRIYIYCALRRREGWEYSLAEIRKAMKGRSGREIDRTLHRIGPVGQKVGQKEFFDPAHRSHHSLVEGVNYVWPEFRCKPGKAEADHPGGER